MRVVFFGTPAFASTCLEEVISSKHRVVSVVCGPDRPKGRGRKIEYPDVKKVAVGQNLEILQPENLKDPSFLEKLKSFKADIFCVVAFRILPEEVLGLPPSGCVNLHASLLPKYRGAAPINWAIINGETETGLTTFFIKKKVDTGDIILQEKVGIGQDETFGDIHDRMANLGGKLLVATLDLIETGDYKIKKQDESLVSKAPKIYPEMGKIDWAGQVSGIHNLIRGLSPKPGAYTFIGDRKTIIMRSRISERHASNATPGTVIQADHKKGIVVACGDAAIELCQLKPASGRAITGAEFVRGFRLSVGDRLGG